MPKITYGWHNLSLDSYQRALELGLAAIPGQSHTVRLHVTEHDLPIAKKLADFYGIEAKRDYGLKGNDWRLTIQGEELVRVNVEGL